MRNKTYKLSKLERNRKSILTEDLKHCYMCGMNYPQLHEVYFGKNRQNSMEYGCVVPLCQHCHSLVHNNIEYDSKLKKEMQKCFEKTYDINFIDVFKKNYL